jgi:hypothetical protein
MEFRDFAQHETSALIGSLATAWSDKSAREFQTFHQALKKAADAAEKALHATRAADPAALAGLVDRLTAAAKAHAGAAADRIHREAQTALEEVQARLKAQIDENAGLAASLKEADARAAALDAARREAEALLEQSLRENSTLAANQADLRAHHEAARTEIANLLGRLDAQTAERARLDEALTAARQELQDAETRMEALSAQHASTLREQVIRHATQGLDRLLGSFQRLGTTKTFDDVLAALVDGIAQEFTRVALFQVNGNRLEGVQHVGFDFDNDMSKVVVPLGMDSMLTHAVRSGRVQGFTAGELTDSSRALFGGSPSFVLVLPIAVAGEILAVLYADDSDQPQIEFATPERKVKFAQILLWHAAPKLPKLVEEWKARAELREYATMLVNEIETMYAADRKAGKKTDQLQMRLAGNVEYARRLFAQRADLDASTGPSVLDEHFAAVIKAKSATPFGSDIAAVISRMDRDADGAVPQSAHA